MKNFMLRNIPVDLHTRLKLLAVKKSATEDRQISMRELILEAIQEKLDQGSEK